MILKTCGAVIAIGTILGMAFGVYLHLNEIHEPKGAPSVADTVEILAGDVAVIRAERNLESARRQLVDAERQWRRTKSAAARQDFEWAQDNYAEAKRRYHQALTK